MTTQRTMEITMGPTAQAKIQTGFRIDPRIYAALSTYSRETQTSKTGVVERAVLEFLQKQKAKVRGLQEVLDG